MTPAPAYVALGSNRGEPLARLRHAALRLTTLGTVLARSSLYRTAPVGGPPGQCDYLNAVVALAPRLPPTAAGARRLLADLLAVETALGRVRAERWGPRVIDLDLLAWGDLVIAPGCDVGAGDAAAGSDLVLPHPRLRERAFVLVPLCEVAAATAAGGGWVDPVTGHGECALAAALAEATAAAGVPGAAAVALTDLRW